MKKLFVLIAATLMAVGSLSAQRVTVYDANLLEEYQALDSWRTQIDWMPNWGSIGNVKGYILNVDSWESANYSGCIQKINPVEDLSINDTVFMSMTFLFSGVTRQNLEGWPKKSGILKIGLAAGDSVAANFEQGQNKAYSAFSDTSQIGFTFKQGWWQGNPATTWPEGSMSVSSTMGNSFTASSFSDWGVANLDAADATTDAISDTMRCDFIAIKTATLNTFSVAATVTNLNTNAEVVSIDFQDYVCESAYNDDSLFFTSGLGDMKTTKHALIAVKLEKGMYSVPTLQENIKVSSLTVSPNPTTGFIQLSQEVKFAEVYTTTGALVKTISNTTSLDVSDLGNGIYFLRTGEEVVKFIKQ